MQMKTYQLIYLQDCQIHDVFIFLIQLSELYVCIKNQLFLVIFSVHTQRRFNVHTTSVTLFQRLYNIHNAIMTSFQRFTLYVYWADGLYDQAKR